MAIFVWKVALGLLIISTFISVVAWTGNLDHTTKPASTGKTLAETEPRIPIQGTIKEASLYRSNRSGSYYLTGDRLCMVFI